MRNDELLRRNISLLRKRIEILFIAIPSLISVEVLVTTRSDRDSMFLLTTSDADVFSSATLWLIESVTSFTYKYNGPRILNAIGTGQEKPLLKEHAFWRMDIIQQKALCDCFTQIRNKNIGYILLPKKDTNKISTRLVQYAGLFSTHSFIVSNYPEPKIFDDTFVLNWNEYE